MDAALEYVSKQHLHDKYKEWFISPTLKFKKNYFIQIRT